MPTTNWNSIALFFNLPTSNRPNRYSHTNKQDVLNWFDLGTNPAPITVSEFVNKYWKRVSYGNLDIGLKTIKDNTGEYIIPTITPRNNDAGKWKDIINQILDSYAEQIWKESGELMSHGKRWIPSIVLVQNYHVTAQAIYTPYSRMVSQIEYLIGDINHIKYNLEFTSSTEHAELTELGRKFWGILTHEYGHNFLDFGDLYHPQGTTGYWDLLGDNLVPGKMSEISSHFKNRVGWLDFKHEIKASQHAETVYNLRPYTTSADAIKIVPDRLNNPDEFFILEYRKSTGDELWMPDGGLTSEGLLITHYNIRLGLTGIWLMREAPYYDPEFADYSEMGAADWTGYNKMDGVLFPFNGNNSFGRFTRPSSNFYGDQPSGITISNIKISRGKCKFSLKINRYSYIGWEVEQNNIGVSGRFHGPDEPSSIFMIGSNQATLLEMKESQWLATHKTGRLVGDWQLNLAKDKPPLVGDFDGDGKDEIYFRSDEKAGIVSNSWISWESYCTHDDWIDDWNLGANDWEIVANLDADLQDEIVIRSASWIGVFKLMEEGGAKRLKLQYIKKGKVGTWKLEAGDKLHAGYFRYKHKQDVLITANDDVGLLIWSGSRSVFYMLKKHHDRIGEWNIGSKDQFYVGDFDGDGYDEIYVRSASWAGLLKWSKEDGEFKLLWIKKDRIEHENGNSDDGVKLNASNTSYVGRFLQDRDCILHRASKVVAILAWDGNEMQVRQKKTSKFGGKWELAAEDKFIIGDYHRVEQDEADPTADLIGDNISDVFMHNKSGTGMLGVNHRPGNGSNKTREEMGLTWIQKGFLLASR